ncbi:MAG: 2-amino-4-hydroxy-6-hydroxymethyldihydropteridine diphosphokinase [Chloroflexi bacterium]|nr:2-amino-4-hydroxy-6-hydroxymethyldihydropteridine diphosphokinase [Chloroflexota bacterium]
MSVVDNPMQRVCIELGSNIEPAVNIPRAAALLHDYFTVLAISSAWETPPVGCTGCGNYINAAMLIESSATAEALKTQLRAIESQLGRVRTNDKFAARTIDLDVLLIDDVLIEPDLWKYAHLAVPVAELLPELQQPQDGRRLCDLANDLLAETPITLRAEVLLNPPQ